MCTVFLGCIALIMDLLRAPQTADWLSIRGEILCERIDTPLRTWTRDDYWSIADRYPQFAIGADPRP